MLGRRLLMRVRKTGRAVAAVPCSGRDAPAVETTESGGHVEVVRTTRALLLIDADVGLLVQVATRARARCTASGTLRSAPPLPETERWRQRALSCSRPVHLLDCWGSNPSTTLPFPSHGADRDVAASPWFPPRR
ncbi:hypothetical protein HPB50_018892 [Hyalomma asiaticum]|uniref:Uncharacterized protein n=1 Tax=Hyalomma asiaticum TaxID=266040 RepID=A0ACB7TK41_HYAAI|nr:hypothetical protein HPB50_018892 [Hyalomma asiaticum]